MNEIGTLVRFFCLCLGCVLLGMGAMLWLLTWVAHRRLLAAGEPGLGFEWTVCWIPIGASAIFFYIALTV